jgi:PPOX class probable F420-dependent enzyme
MRRPLSERARRLLSDRNFAVFASLSPDGWPHVTPVWVDISEDGMVLVNTSKGRVKERNVRRDSRVAICVMNSSNPYEYVSIKGEVSSLIEGRQAAAHIDALSRKYTGEPWRARPHETRVMIKVRPLSEY